MGEIGMGGMCGVSNMPTTVLRDPFKISDEYALQKRKNDSDVPVRTHCRDERKG
jgi:hypothetical protein